MRIKSHVTYFLIPTIIALLVGGFFLMTYSRDQIHLYINSFHTPSADMFFKYITNLGEGWLFLLGIPAFFYLSWRSGIVIGLAGIFTGLVTGLFKNTVFSGYPRPIEHFKGIADLYLVPGVEMNHWNSFPSGHTMAAFALYFSLALVVKKKGWSIVFFILAALVAYSRMYLSQHFLVDVVAGAGLGVLCATAAYLIANRLRSTVLNQKATALFSKKN